MLSNFRPLVSRVLSNTPKMSFASKDHFYQLMQLDETRRDLMLSIEKFADEEVKPLASKMDNEDVFPKHMWKRMG